MSVVALSAAALLPLTVTFAAFALLSDTPPTPMVMLAAATVFSEMVLALMVPEPTPMPPIASVADPPALLPRTVLPAMSIVPAATPPYETTPEFELLPTTLLPVSVSLVACTPPAPLCTYDRVTLPLTIVSTRTRPAADWLRMPPAPDEMD